MYLAQGANSVLQLFRRKGCRDSRLLPFHNVPQFVKKTRQCGVEAPQLICKVEGLSAILYERRQTGRHGQDGVQFRVPLVTSEIAEDRCG